MPKTVQRPPISRHWAASVATHGVYAIRNTMKASAAGIGCPPEDCSNSAITFAPRSPGSAVSEGSSTA